MERRALLTRLRWRKRTYSFAAIAGVGVHESENSDGRHFWLLATLKNGETVGLVHRNIGPIRLL
jgi:hypothetical protein